MKNLYRICLFICVPLLCALSACDYANGEGSGAENAVYMQTPGSKGVIDFEVGKEGGSVVLTPRLANITSQAVKIQLAYDSKILDEYNKRNKTNYEVFPESEVKLIDKTGKDYTGKIDLIVENGEFATQVEVKIEELDENKYPLAKHYAIPLLITETSAYRLIPSQKTVLLMLNRQIITSIARISWGTISVTPSNPKKYEEWTLQMSAIYYNLEHPNLTTVNIGNSGGSEFYTRIMSKKGIQIKNGRDGDDTWTGLEMKTGRWMNIAYVYKNSTVTVYVNGQVQKVFPTNRIWVAENSYIYFGNSDYKKDCVREVRLWSKALTDREINDNIYLPVSKESAHLEVYLPLTKEQGVKDLIAPENVNNVRIGERTEVEWVENVKFPADELIVVDL